MCSCGTWQPGCVHAAGLTGEVPDLLGPDDIEEISNGLRPIMAAAGMPITKMSVYSFFVLRWVHRPVCVWGGLTGLTPFG
jgi:hypothetical protein